MPRFSVLLNGRGILLKSENGKAERGGFFVPCVVEASDARTAGEQAMAALRSHETFLHFSCWTAEDSADGRPIVVVESVERLPWWRRPKAGISAGFILYPGPDEGD